MNGSSAVKKRFFPGVFDLKPIMSTSINIPKLELDDSNVEKMSPLSDFNLVKLYSTSLHMRHWIIVGKFYFDTSISKVFIKGKELRLFL